MSEVNLGVSWALVIVQIRKLLVVFAQVSQLVIEAPKHVAALHRLHLLRG